MLKAGADEPVSILRPLLGDLDGKPVWKLIHAEVLGAINRGARREAPYQWTSWAGDHQTGPVTGRWGGYPVYGAGTGGRGPKPMPKAIRENRALRRDFLAMCRSVRDTLPFSTGVLRAIPAINYVAVAVMGPDSRLRPHVHDNHRCRVAHVALALPPEPGTSGITVGPDTHLWRHPGDWIVFDDKLLHHAWNDGSGDRVLLHIDYTP